MVSLAQQQSLPMELCSDNMAGKRLDQDGPDGFFHIPDCSKYVPTQGVNAIKTQADSVRISNAANLPKAVFPKGLSFVTNNELYTVGDINTSADPASPDATNWVPVFITGYRPMVLSSKWQDSSAPWHLSTFDRRASRTPANLKINAAFGNARYIFYNEEWSGYKVTINGPKIVGLVAPEASASLRGSGRRIAGVWYVGDGNICTLPREDWTYDKHYELLPNSPPGLPYIDIFSILSFIRE